MKWFDPRVICSFGLLATAMIACGQNTTIAPTERPVLIPPTTKMLDSSARTALKSVQADGTLRFDTSTAIPDLKVNDVIVSEVGPATPNGLLRKVKALRSEGNVLVVETQNAKLVDAIHSGRVKVSQKLEFGNAVQTTGFGRVRISEKRLEVDTDFGTNGVIHATGPIVIDPILDMDMDISCNNKVLGACAEIPDLNMSASIGLNEVMDLKFTGKATPGFDKQVQLAAYTFPPIKFTIGPVPIIIVPRLVLYLRSNGKLSARFETTTRQNLNLVVGFKFNSDTGFTDTSQRGGTFDTDQPSFDGTAEVKTSLGVRFELLFWGVLGPYGALEAGPRFEANTAGIGPEKRLWKLEKCLDLNIGVRIDVLIYEANWERTVASACDFVRQQNNSAPSVVIQQPTTVTQIFAGVTTILRPEVFDLDGPVNRCQWSSSLSTDVMPNDSCDQQLFGFSSVGKRTLTVTAIDPAGATASSSVEVSVQTKPAILVSISNPLASQPNVAPFAQASLEAGADGGQGPYTFVWSIVYPTNSQGDTKPPVLGQGIHPAVIDLNSILIGTGNPLLWTPATTLNIPNPASCTEFDTYGKLKVVATDKNGVSGQALMVIRLTRIC